MRALRYHLLPIALCVLIGSFTSAPAEASCSAGSCVLVWEDEFNGTSLDSAKWEPMIGNGCAYGLCGWGNNELQYYRSENAIVANGELTITAKQEDFGGANYTSARLRTKNLGDWTYGRFEMRAKLPVGQGMWPAFWMLPTNSPYGGWARSGEIDIMEIVGHEPAKIHGTIHYHDQFPDNWQSGSSYDLPGNDPTNYHVYAIEWEEDEIRWYVDGVLYSTLTWWDSVGNPFPAPFDVDFHLLLNLAVGGNWPGNPDGSTVFPQEYVIDYVRVFQVPDTISVFDDMEHGNPYANGWYSFDGTVGFGGVDANGSDLPPVDGGNFSLTSLWTSGGTPGYVGGFGRTNPIEVADDKTEFRMWINPDAGQDYTLEINLQEDDTGNGAADEEFQYNCTISPGGPCAIAGGGWQLVTIPLADFFDDNSFLAGGNGILDPVSGASGGNGKLIDIVMAVISNSGADVRFRTDYWYFYAALPDTDGDGVDDSIDNCTDVANPAQIDTDGDLHGNACDGDFSLDCVTNIFDLFPFKAAFGSSDPADAQFDMNSTGGPVAVNIFDLFKFKAEFGTSPGPSAPGALCP